MPRLATVKELNQNTLVVSPPEEQKVDKSKVGKDGKKKKDTIKYFTSKLHYKESESSEMQEFYLDYPVASCVGGVLEKENDDGSVNRSIKLSFSSNDEEEAREIDSFIVTGDVIDDKIRQQVFDHRVKFKMDSSFTMDMIRPPLVKPFLYRAVNSDGVKIAGSSPSQYIKLQEFDNFRTPFFDLNDQQVPWEVLQNVEFRCIVTARIRHIYHGQKNSLQFQAKQVQIVSSVTPIKEYNMHSSVSAFYREKNSDIVKQQEETIRLLRAKLDEQVQPEVENDDSDEDIMK